MNADLVDKLVEKFGPIGAEAVRQVQMLGLAKMIGGSIVFVFSMILSYVAYRLGVLAAKTENDEEVLRIVAAVVCGTIALVGLIVSPSIVFEGVAEYLAPLQALLK